MDKRLTMLMILDGFGENSNDEGNAVNLAKKPNLDKLRKICPVAHIDASGAAVGLPDGQMGNSEVGHTNIGAGRIVYQKLTKITKSIEDGDFFSIPEFTEAIENVKKNNSKLHIMGLLSDGGVHSHQRHLYGLLELARRKGLDNNVFIHAFMDGRDTLPASGEGYIQELQEKMQEKGEKAYNAIVRGEGVLAKDPIQAIEESYQKEVFDEFVVPTVITDANDKPLAKVENGDSVIFFNFRPDRARQLTRAIVDDKFDGFKTDKLDIDFVCMTEYDDTMPNVKVAVKSEELVNTFGEVVSKLGKKQLRIAETEKYAHVTFFFNGGREEPYPGEDRILVNSPKVATYDLQPEMSAYEVTEKVVEAINSKKYDSIILNFANTDMVGHTGNIDAAIKAVEAVDKCVGEIVEAVQKQNGVLLITADHGNAEQMIDYKTGEPLTSHTTNLVPLILVGMENVELKDGRLCDLAPTMLDIMEEQKPKEMTGESLLIRK